MSIVTKWLDASLSAEVDLGPGYVLDGDPIPSERSTAASQFSAQTIVAKRLDGLRCHFDIMLDGAQLLPPKGHAPQFSAHVYCGQMVAHLSYC